MLGLIWFLLAEVEGGPCDNDLELKEFIDILDWSWRGCNTLRREMLLVTIFRCFFFLSHLGFRVLQLIWLVQSIALLQAGRIMSQSSEEKEWKEIQRSRVHAYWRRWQQAKCKYLDLSNYQFEDSTAARLHYRLIHVC